MLERLADQLGVSVRQLEVALHSTGLLVVEPEGFSI